jgi:hypothetical protein
MNPIGMRKKSISPTDARRNAWWNRTVVPSTLTARRPIAALPSVRPRHRVSNAVNHTTTVRRLVRMATTAPLTPSADTPAARPASSSATSVAARASMSMAKPSVRDATPARSKSRTTASGVMIGCAVVAEYAGWDVVGPTTSAR